ncbi:hypothetical protein [Novosphingobium sp. TH158]|uniref:hypothetical protein n=1 Tax=Novosphingobium sp. TH158 TaxID=2067455 RepID=UPI0020B14C84|nr:hypothetical protein [Novosphingobium sp. TH158]
MMKRIGAVGAIVALALTLSACLLTPGRFVSALDLRKDGQFTFTYKGEISMFGLAQLAAMDKRNSEFKESPCYDYESPAPAKSKKKGAEEEDDTFAEPKERPCTAEELAEQKLDWEEARKESAAREKKDLEEMKAALGGLDPTDPKSIEEFAGRLRRQAGWKAVTYKGDGLFDVDYAIAGKVDHDFIFPIIEKFPTTNTFVQVLRRNDGTVRIDAPGFNPGSTTNPMAQAMGMGALSTLSKSEKMPKGPEMEGTFTLTTNGQILANNTDEGAKPGTTGQMLEWKVNVRTTATPTALVKLAN